MVQKQLRSSLSLLALTLMGTVWASACHTSEPQPLKEKIAPEALQPPVVTDPSNPQFTVVTSVGATPHAAHKNAIAEASAIRAVWISSEVCTEAIQLVQSGGDKIFESIRSYSYTTARTAGVIKEAEPYGTPKRLPNGDWECSIRLETLYLFPGRQLRSIVAGEPSRDKSAAHAAWTDELLDYAYAVGMFGYHDFALAALWLRAEASDEPEQALATVRYLLERTDLLGAPNRALKLAATVPGTSELAEFARLDGLVASRCDNAYSLFCEFARSLRKHANPARLTVVPKEVESSENVSIRLAGIAPIRLLYMWLDTEGISCRHPQDPDTGKFSPQTVRLQLATPLAASRQPMLIVVGSTGPNDRFAGFSETPMYWQDARARDSTTLDRLDLTMNLLRHILYEKACSVALCSFD